METGLVEAEVGDGVCIWEMAEVVVAEEEATETAGRR